MLELFMPMIPPTTTHQQKKVHVVNGKPIYYESEDLKKARAKLSAHLAEHIPDEPLDGPLQCIVKWLFPTKAKKHVDGDWKATRPDTHNLNKLLFDVMTDLGYWTDDARVASETIQKFWVKESMPGIYIKIEELM